MGSGHAAMNEYEKHMHRCLELARIARDRGDTPVGSVVVIDDVIVGEGIEELPAGNNVTGHAEVLACQAAVDSTGSRFLDGATLYSTAERCFMCSYVIRQCRIALVVYGVDSPDVGGVTSSRKILTDPQLSAWRPAPPRVIHGVLREACERLRAE